MVGVEFHPEAAVEFEEAFVWYAERSEQAAEGFNRAISQAIEEIQSNPFLWPLLDQKHRIRILRKRYPYHIIYKVDREIIIVVAICHHRRKPKYWADRNV